MTKAFLSDKALCGFQSFITWLVIIILENYLSFQYHTTALSSNKNILAFYGHYNQNQILLIINI